MTYETAKKILERANGDAWADYDQAEISADEIGKISGFPDVCQNLGNDIFFVPQALDSGTGEYGYDLETDWARGPCIIGPSDGGHRTVVHL